ncbi:LamG-like jellyroll fold domain-containing protein [Pleionea sp. CnH1-48]|uniref:LamG-like jellyroll fold domain-containing protein n=1 Tax=Pleionea sp. CnH1-48 TaxID=2954494 RepID=UPI0020968A7C|nr:LamG-like jellyroll fold domain-containing protein [Pleionea sp. CnH1-48]MCO7227091.1 winged helix-turn-helix domain-containing protein [Pleionea sp. CnH1-48]
MDMSQPFLVDHLLVEPQENRITNGEQVISIEPRVMAVLVLLATHAGQLVLRETIYGNVWGKQTVNENSLNRNIASLRKVIDDQPDLPSRIKTVPKRGYVLQAKVIPQGSERKEILDTQGSDVSSRKFIYIASVIVASMFAFSIYLFLYVKEELESMTVLPTIFPKTSITLAPDDKSMAFCFDGIDDYVEIKNHASLNFGENDFSMSAWIKTESQDLVVIVDKRFEQRSGNVKGFSFHLYKGILSMQLADGDGDWVCAPKSEQSSCTNYISKAFVADGQWHLVHVTVARKQADGIKFYLDGELKSSADPRDRMGSLSNDEVLRLGSRTSSLSGFFPGSIGEVRLYNYVLDGDEVIDNFTKGRERSCER